jgi:hypothetical protein
MVSPKALCFSRSTTALSPTKRKWACSFGRVSKHQAL